MPPGPVSFMLYNTGSSVWAEGRPNDHRPGLRTCRARAELGRDRCAHFRWWAGELSCWWGGSQRSVRGVAHGDALGLLPHLYERQRRLVLGAGVLLLSLGPGGTMVVAHAAGWAWGRLPEECAFLSRGVRRRGGRVRRPGGSLGPLLQAIPIPVWPGPAPAGGAESTGRSDAAAALDHGPGERTQLSSMRFPFLRPLFHASTTSL